MRGTGEAEKPQKANVEAKAIVGASESAMVEEFHPNRPTHINSWIGAPLTQLPGVEPTLVWSWTNASTTGSVGGRMAKRPLWINARSSYKQPQRNQRAIRISERISERSVNGISDPEMESASDPESMAIIDIASTPSSIVVIT
jgi:hypothetical protein